MKYSFVSVSLFMGLFIFTQAQQPNYTGSTPSYNQYETYLYLEEGKKKMNVNRHAEAVMDFNRVINSDPFNAEALTLRGNAYFVLKRYQEALNDYNQAITLYERQYGAGSRSINANSNAYYSGRDGISIVPSNGTGGFSNTLSLLYNNRGAVNYQLNRIPEANRDFEQALSLNPSLVSARENLGKTSGGGDTFSWNESTNSPNPINQQFSVEDSRSLRTKSYNPGNPQVYNNPSYSNQRYNSYYSSPSRSQDNSGAGSNQAYNQSSQPISSQPINVQSQPINISSQRMNMQSDPLAIPRQSNFPSQSFTPNSSFNQPSPGLQAGDNMTSLAPSRERIISPRRKSLLDYFRYRIYRNPTVVSQSSEMAEITRIAVEENGTFIQVEVINDSTDAIGVKVIAPGQRGAHYMIDPATNLTYELRAVNGPVSAYSATWVDPGDKLAFELVFDRIPESTRFIHLVEDTDDKGEENISFYDVYLD